ncbi:MAG: hypothetical protein ABI765_13480, partial [Gemmatimonadota bacterium]
SEKRKAKSEKRKAKNNIRRLVASGIVSVLCAFASLRLRGSQLPLQLQLPLPLQLQLPLQSQSQLQSQLLLPLLQERGTKGEEGIAVLCAFAVSQLQLQLTNERGGGPVGPLLLPAAYGLRLMA